MESVRKRFKSSRYDDYDTYFENGGFVPVLLGELLRGVMNSRVFWDTMDGMYRKKPRRRSSYGRGGHSPHRGGIRFPSGGGIRMGRSGRRSGGFRTGGGF